MGKYRLKKAFLTSIFSHLFLILLFTLAFNQEDLNQSSGKMEQFEISEHQSSSKSQSKTVRISHSKGAESALPIPQTVESGTQNDSLTAGNSYDSVLRQKISSQEHYPLEARKRHLEDTIEVGFTLNDSGEIMEITTNSPGKSPILMNAALVAVKQAAPFPPPPPGISRKFMIPIEFKIK